MKIAYLILCHKSPAQVSKLIQQLDNDEASFFIHVDKKANDFSITSKENIYFVPEIDRVDVKWATVSMIDATLNLIKCVLDSGVSFDYVCLLSGQDFPIKDNKKIVEFFTDDHAYNYIEVLEHSDPIYERYSKRNLVYYPTWMFSRHFIVKVLKRIYIYISGGYHNTFSFFRYHTPFDNKYEYGSQWWALTGECLSWVYDFIIEKDMRNIYKNSMTPDESFFQTAFMQSPYKETRRDRITFFEWDKNQNNARQITEEDLDFLLNSKYLFARKFDLSNNPNVIEKLQRKIENQEQGE